MKKQITEEDYCVIIGSPEGRVLNFSDNTLEIFECQRKDLINKYFIELTAPEDITKSIHFWSELKNSRTNEYSFEKTYISPSGKKIPAKVTVLPIRDENGNLIYAVVKITPITEKTKLETKTSISLEDAIKNIDMPLAIMSNDGTIISVNNKFLETTNTKKEQIISKKLWSIFSDDITLEKTIKSFISKGEKSISIRTSTKTTTPNLKTSIKILRLSDDKFIAEILGIQEKEISLNIPDLSKLSPKTINSIISSLKLGNFKVCEGKECIYRSTYQKFATLLHITEDLIVKEIDIPESIFESRVKGNEISYINITPIKDEIVFNSPSSKEIEKTIIGKSIEENFKKEIVSCVKEFLAEYYEGLTKEFSVEIEELGEKKFFEIRGRKISDDEYVLIIFNITPIKKYESLLLAEKEFLKREVEEKRKFWSVISHEMRTPLNSILGFLQLIERDKKLPVEIIDYLKAIKVSSTTLLNLINDVLEYSRLEELEQRVELKESILVEEILETLKSLFPKAKEKNIRIVPSFSPNTPYKVITDPYKLRRIIMNLVDNSIKFSPQNTLTRVEVKVIEDDPKECKIEIKVKDQGIGIPKDKINDIFKPFYQVDSSLSRKYGGSGLGLPIVKKMVETLGGEMKVESEENVGTTFYITIPVEKVDNTTIGEYIKNKILSMNQKIILSKNTLKLCFSKIIKNRSRLFKDLLNTKIFIVSSIKDIDKFQDGIIIICIKEITKEISQKLADLKKSKKVKIVIISDESSKKLPNIYDYIFHPCTSLVDMIEEITKTKQKIGSSEEQIREILQKRKPSIMIVEDNIINSMFIQKVFENIGIKPTICSTPKEVLELIEKETFDIIFMDVQMEGIDGYTLTKIIRNKNLPKQPTIIGLSAQAFQEDIKEGLESGMDDYLTKPVSIEKIYQKLIEHLIEKKEQIDTKPSLQEIDLVSKNSIERIRNIAGEEFQTFLLSTVKIFKEEFSKEIDRIKKEFSKNNLESIRQITHKLKGSCYELGFIKLGKMFENIEFNAKEGKNIITTELLQEIEKVFEDTMKEISKFIP